MTQKKPTLCVVAGPNGSGKTTTTVQLLNNEWTADSLYINPDNIAQEMFGDWNSPEDIKIITFPIITISTDVMELTKSDKRQLKDIIRRGILRRCEEWLKETGELINKEYSDDENAFDRCMEVTKRSRDYFKEAMGREDYYRNTMIELGVYVLLREGYLTFEDLTELRPEVQSDIKQRVNL